MPKMIEHAPDTKTSTPPGEKKSPGGSRPKGNVLAILGRLLRYLSAYKAAVIVLVIGFLLSAALSLAPAWLLRNAFDRYLVPGKTTFLWYTAFAMLGAAVLQGAIDFVTRYVAESNGQRTVYAIRKSVYRHLMDLSFSYYDNTRTGDILSRITADAETLQSFLGFASVHILSNSLFIIGILVVMFFWDVRLALLYIAILPFILFGITRYAFRVRPANRRIRRILGSLTEFIQEQLQGMQIIKVFGREKKTVKDFDRVNERYFNVNLEAGRITSFWMPFVFVIIGLGTGVVLWFGGLQVIGNRISLGTLVGFTTYIGMMMRPIRQTGMLVSQAMMASAAAERIFEVLDSEPEVRDEPGAVDVPAIRGEVSYDHVRFSYDKSTPILNDITFHVGPGETIAIVGPTGAGKTTLAHMLPRFYDVDGGEIRIDGKPVKDFTLASLRRHIGVVMQHVFLFNLTLRENLAFGRPGATMDEIRAAARAAELDDFIMGLPDRYETMAGERGVKLSGGQRQRLSIARTLLMDPALLILDEPTSSVDSDTDAKIQTALANLCAGRTVFMIAHRLWTLRNATRILVLDRGRIGQFGTHEELLAQPGLYRDIYTMQTGSEQFDIADTGVPADGEDA